MCRRWGSGSVLAVIGQAARHVGTSLRAIGSVFGNPDVRKLQLAWGATSLRSGPSRSPSASMRSTRAGRLRSASRLWSACCRPPSSPRSQDCSGIGTPAAWSWSEAPRSLQMQSGARQPPRAGPRGRGLPARQAGDDRSSPYVPAEGALLPAVARSPQELSASNVAHSAMDNIGFLVAGVLGGVLLATTSPQTVFVAASAASLIARCCFSDCTVTSDNLRRRGGERRLREDECKALRHSSPTGSCVSWARCALLVFFEALSTCSWSSLRSTCSTSVRKRRISERLLGGGGAARGGAAGDDARARTARNRTGGGKPARGRGPDLRLGAFRPRIPRLGRSRDRIRIRRRRFTLLQRLGSDEVLARVLGTLETLRFVAMALGSISAPLLVSLLGIEGALLAFGALLPLFALAEWSALRSFEFGAPVEESHFALLRADPIFAPLPVDTLERLSHDLRPVAAAPAMRSLPRASSRPALPDRERASRGDP